MKRLLTIVLALILILASDYGVSLARGRTEWGLKFGLDFDNNAPSSQDPFGVTSVNDRLGVAFGLFITSYVNERIAFQPEIYYAIRGYTYRHSLESTNYSSNIERKVRTDYLEVPLLIKFIAIIGKIQPNFLIGPALGVPVRSRSDYQLDEYSNGEYHSYSSRSHAGYNNWGEVGLVIGGGLDFVVGRGKVLVDARYNLQFMQFIDLGSTGGEEKPVLCLRIGYAF